MRLARLVGFWYNGGAVPTYTGSGRRWKHGYVYQFHRVCRSERSLPLREQVGFTDITGNSKPVIAKSGPPESSHLFRGAAFCGGYME